VLARHRLDYVIVGSVAARFYGLELEPGDLDIVPAVDRANLERLLAVIEAIEGWPQGPFGDWRRQPNGEWKWLERPTTRAELEAWSPDVNDVNTFDALCTSRFGNLDIVPMVNGTHTELKLRAVLVRAEEHEVWVAHVDDLLARLTVPRRPKDAVRVRALREFQRRQRRPSSPDG
jgi:hypothetical protein